MTNHDDPSKDAAPPDEQLVAYLDGELEPEDRQHIEELLAADVGIRRRVHEMERTWELLDDLDTSPTGGQFAQTTLEMVAVAAGEDAQRSRAEAPRRRRRRRLMIGGGLLAAALAGVSAALLLLPDPNRQLLRDLPVLENLDQYRPVGDAEFLRMLRQRGLFSKEDGEASAGDTARPDETPAQRRQRIERMSPGEKEQLLRLGERFAALDADQQQRLRRLHQSLQEDADGPQLRQVMRRYCEWLKTLPSYARAELAELTPVDRVKSVEKRLREQQFREGGWRLGGKDAEALLRWMGEHVARHENQLLQSLPEAQRKNVAELTPTVRRRMLLWQLWQRWQAAGLGSPPPMMTDGDLARLIAALGPETRTRLESKPTAEQWRQVADWMRHAVRQRSVRGPFADSETGDQRLADFFEHELTDQQRSRLLAMPGDEMQRALQRMYLTRTRPSKGPGRRPDGRRHDAWHDEGRPTPNGPRRSP